jgi:hypothetical protein
MGAGYWFSIDRFLMIFSANRYAEAESTDFSEERSFNPHKDVRAKC